MAKAPNGYSPKWPQAQMATAPIQNLVVIIKRRRGPLAVSTGHPDLERVGKEEAVRGERVHLVLRVAVLEQLQLEGVRLTKCAIIHI